MKNEEVNRLLERYYQGDSTDIEEMALRAFFSGDNVPEEYEAEKAIFGYYLSSVDVPEPTFEFESVIIESIERAESKRTGIRFRKLLMPLTGVAAGLLILAGSYFFFIHKGESRDTFSDPEIAYAETMKILMDVSSRLNKGVDGLEPVGKMNTIAVKGLSVINETTSIAEKNLKNLENLRNAVQVQVQERVIDRK